MIQIRVVVPQKHFFLIGYFREDIFWAQYFTKVVAANQSSTDTLLLWRALATINFIYKMNLTDLFEADLYFKGALAAIHLICTIIFSGGHLQWSSIFNGTVSFKQALAVIPFFIGIELIRQSSCSHRFDELPFFHYKRLIVATHSLSVLCFCKTGILATGY